MVHMVSIFKEKGQKKRLWLVFMGTGLILKPWSDVHSKSRFNLKTCKAFSTNNSLVIFGTTKQQNTIFSRNKQHKITTWFYFQNVFTLQP